jgi:hypothetical protein
MRAHTKTHTHTDKHAHIHTGMCTLTSPRSPIRPIDIWYNPMAAKQMTITMCCAYIHVIIISYTCMQNGHLTLIRVESYCCVYLNLNPHYNCSVQNNSKMLAGKVKKYNRLHSLCNMTSMCEWREEAADEPEPDAEPEPEPDELVPSSGHKNCTCQNKSINNYFLVIYFCKLPKCMNP